MLPAMPPLALSTPATGPMLFLNRDPANRPRRALLPTARVQRLTIHPGGISQQSRVNQNPKTP